MTLDVKSIGNITTSISKGEISFTITWNVVDSTEDRASLWNTLEERVRAWAGNIGDPFPMPSSDASTVEPNDDIEITNISITPEARFIYKVVFTGSLKNMTPELIGNISTQQNRNKEYTKTGVWLVSVDDPTLDTATQLSSWLPAIGDVLTWDGPEVICEDINISAESYNQYKVTIKARCMSVLMKGLPRKSIDSLLQKQKTATWIVDRDTLDSWLPSIGDHIGESVSDGMDDPAWVENDYYITNIDVTPVGYLGYEVTIQATHISVRLVKMEGNRASDSTSVTGHINTKDSFTGTWQCTAEGLSSFDDLVGQPSEMFTGYESDLLISNVSWTQKGTNEFEVKVVAATPTVKNGGNSDANAKKNLENKREVEITQGTHTLTANQCGWLMYGSAKAPVNNIPMIYDTGVADDNGNPTYAQVTTTTSVETPVKPPIGGVVAQGQTGKNYWVPSTDCPVQTSDGFSVVQTPAIDDNFKVIPPIYKHEPLHERFVEVPLPTYIATITEYKTGSATHYMNSVAQHNIVTTPPGVSGLSSSWVVSDASCTEMYSSDGKKMTKITQTFTAFQSEYLSWNPSWKGWSA